MQFPVSNGLTTRRMRSIGAAVRRAISVTSARAYVESHRAVRLLNRCHRPRMGARHPPLPERKFGVFDAETGIYISRAASREVCHAFEFGAPCGAAGRGFRVPGVVSLNAAALSCRGSWEKKLSVC